LLIARLIPRTKFETRSPMIRKKRRGITASIVLYSISCPILNKWSAGKMKLHGLTSVVSLISSAESAEAPSFALLASEGLPLHSSTALRPWSSAKADKFDRAEFQRGTRNKSLQEEGNFLQINRASVGRCLQAGVSDGAAPSDRNRPSPLTLTPSRVLNYVEEIAIPLLVGKVLA